MPSDQTAADSLTPVDTATMEVVNYRPLYTSVPWADRYFSEQLYGQLWEVQSLDRKQKALTAASRVFDSLRFAGSKTAADQPLQFPRNGDTEVPGGVQQAVCEEALALLKGVDAETEFRNTNVSSRVFGKVRTDYAVRSVHPHVVAGLASKRAFDLLVPFLSRDGGVKLRRGS